MISPDNTLQSDSLFLCSDFIRLCIPNNVSLIVDLIIVRYMANLPIYVLTKFIILIVPSVF